MLEVLFLSGLRKSELMRLRLLDVDAERGVLFVRQGKGRKDRVVPIGDRALHWLDRYIQEARPEHCPDPDPGNVFLSRLGKPLSATMVHIRCRHWVEAAGVEKRGNPHAWRHASATALLDGGAGLRHVQAFLGHEHVRTTVLYTEVSATKLREVHQATRPFELPEPSEPE